MYHFPCECGQSLAVELFQAGSYVDCSQCGKSVSVPDSLTLKELSGDPYPFLTPIDKIAATAANGEPPFDGTCHRCATADATMQVPIRFDVLVERHVDDDGGIRPTLSGFEMRAGRAEEEWKTVRFPLLLCDQCHTEFRSAGKRATALTVLTTVVSSSLLLGFIYFAWQHMVFVAGLTGVLSIIGGIAWICHIRTRSTGDSHVIDWLKGVRWAHEAIATEMEFKLTAGRSESYTRTTPSSRR